MRQDRRNKAIGIVEEHVGDYMPENDQYEIVLKVSEDAEEFEETGTLEGFCENCIEPAMKDYIKNHPKEVKGKVVTYECYNASSSESDNFELCERCGIHFNTCLCLDEQELEHWESLNEFGFQGNSSTAYELREILENDNCYTERVNVIAERVIAEADLDVVTTGATVRFVDFLSPDMLESVDLKYGLETTLLVMQWLQHRIFEGTSRRQAVIGRHYGNSISTFFHDALLREWGNHLDRGLAGRYPWTTAIQRREGLSLDSQSVLSLPEHSAWKRELDEGYFGTLFRFIDKPFAVNPQAKFCPERTDWHWVCQDIHLGTDGHGWTLYIVYGAEEASSSGWSLHIDQQNSEHLISFLERAYEELESWIDG